jgi:hypothetical protein
VKESSSFMTKSNLVTRAYAGAVGFITEEVLA